jgi:hypothetical protein
MSWVKWLKGKSVGQTPAADKPVVPRTAAPARRKGGEAYAKEWVKVLEETGPERDPGSTYTWELQPEKAQGGSKPASRPGAKPTEPYDTYTWELQEGDSPDDPWGLQKKEAEATAARKKDGVNPYDTGVFDASWTGRFDQR